MVLRTLLIPKRKKKEMKRRKTGQHKSRKRDRVPDNSMKLFGVIFELSGVLYLYRDFVTVLSKIAAAVTLYNIKMKFIH